MTPKFFEMTGGVKIPAIGLGTWQATNEEELDSALDAALSVGYRHIDTAYAYGNEHVIGRVLKRWFDCGQLKREDVFVTTKLPMNGVHKDRVERFLKESLKDLQLDYVDLYLIHFPVGVKHMEGYRRPPFELMKTEPEDHIQVWKKMEEQLEAGRTRSIGLSNFNRRQIQTILNSCKIKPQNLQVELHICLQQRELVEFCKKNGIVVVAYSPLGTPGYNKFLKAVGKEEKPIPNILQNPIVKEIADKHGKTTGQIALRFLLDNEIIPIPKSVNPSRIKENFDVFDFQLDKEDMKKLKELDMGEAGRICDFKLCPIEMQKHSEFPFGK